MPTSALVNEVLQGGDPTQCDHRSRNALMLAVESEDALVVEELVSPMRFPNSLVKAPIDLFSVDNEGRTALFYAAVRGDEKVIWLLLSALPGTGLCCRRGTLLEVKDRHGRRAEDWARLEGQDAAADLLEKERLRIDMFE